MKRIVKAIAALLFLMMVIDSKAVIAGTADAVELCIKTVIPSLFPFILLSGVIRSLWPCHTLCLLKPFQKLCKLPPGGENLFLIGFISGYPVGAKGVYDSYREGQIDLPTANRMLGFCNNAGPAFIVGMVGVLFERKIVGWVIWGIQIISAVITGALSADRSICQTNVMHNKSRSSVVAAQKYAVHSMALICGWVIIFRVILSIAGKWILWLLPISAQSITAGFLELTNGILRLNQISSPYMRFVLANAFLSFGGLCVILQTMSIAPELNCKEYCKLKLLHSSICILIALCVGFVLFPGNNVLTLIYGILPSSLVCILTLYFVKKNWKSKTKCCIMG